MSHIISWDDPLFPFSHSDTPMHPQLCLPTHQLFDFPDSLSPTSTTPSSPQPTPTLTISTQNPHKRPSSTPDRTLGAKKPRPAGERISTKDFIPPDVSGLSKREARLVKNRAAAFLSRQRKREEFENMEMCVAVSPSRPSSTKLNPFHLFFRTHTQPRC